MKRIERCGKRIIGLYEAETLCSRPKGHSLPHTVNDGIYNAAEWAKAFREIAGEKP